MDSFIKKIFNSNGKECDNIVHVQFQKFSRGEFKDKAVIIYSKSKDKYSLSTTYEYANDFVRMMAEKLGGNRAFVSGVLVSTRDLKGQLNFKDIKQFAGVKQYILDGEMVGSEIINLLDSFPSSFFALSMKIGDTEIKIKPKAPISGKPSTKSSDEQTIKADFCKLYTRDKKVIEGFVFDKEIIENENIKKAEINHVFIINEIILTEREKDPSKMRELAKRKGKIIRTIKVDNSIVAKKEAEFIA